MSSLWQHFVAMITAGDVRVSEHGYDALADDGLTIDNLLNGASAAIVVEEYLDYPKGESCTRAPDGFRGDSRACGLGRASRVQ